MNRRDISLTLSLCASLVLHALLLAAVANAFSRQFGARLHLPPVVRGLSIPPLLVDQPDTFQRLGDSSGAGDSIRAAPGDAPLQAPKAAQGQPFLSLDPVGFGQVGDEPSPSALPRGAPSPQEAQSQPQAAQNADPSPIGLAQASEEFSAPISSPKPASAVATATPVMAAPPAPAGASSSADPAPQADSESDPVSTVGSVEFHPGSTEVRLGRKHKITRPRLSLAARTDLMTLRSPTVVLKIHTDPTGKVTAVQVYRSSGSSEVDQPCKLAAYNWWFEPPKNAKGQATSDVLLFAIHFI